MSTVHETDPSSSGRRHGRAATAAARTLLEAYYLQDQREGLLRRGESRRAAAAGAEALDRMATAYEVEFPHVDRARARAAGESFMRALFVQDEIENWELLRRDAASALRGVLVSDPDQSYGSNAGNDARWRLVRECLGETCGRVEIDERYAEMQTEFWLLHGQLNEYWEGLAVEAHEHKLRAMVDDPPRAVVDRTGEWFVEGVKLHDDWDHRDRDRDLDEMVELVACYYREVFDLRFEG
jgi:hypothetical protein